MTTIPSRVDRLARVVDSLSSQTWPVAEIRLYVPELYARFPGDVVDIGRVDQRVNVTKVARDLGPLTKVAYAVEDLKCEDVLVLACDDDMNYEPDWVERFVRAHEEVPDACLVQSGGFLSQFSSLSESFCASPRARYKGLGYRVRRAVSLGSWKPRSPFRKSGYVDIGEGWAGFLLKPGWFALDFMDIPNEIRLVDDIWISAYLASKGVGIWLIENALRPVTSEIAQTDALNQITESGQERNYLNNKAVHLLRERFGIWS